MWVFLSKLLAFLMRNYFPKRPLGALLHTLSKLYDVPVGFVSPSPSFEAVYYSICCRRRVAVARYRMIGPVLISHVGGISLLFLHIRQNEGKYVSCYKHVVENFLFGLSGFFYQL